MSSNKTLLLVRHAKSSWDYENVSDIDRPLKLRGINDAYEMANRLKMKNITPDIVLTSPANRAFHTANIFARVLELNFSNFIVLPAIYGSGPDELLRIIKKMPGEYGCIMMVGHNPDMNELVNMLQKNRVYEMSTCAVATLEFDSKKWEEIDRKSLISGDFDYPKKEY